MAQVRVVSFRVATCREDRNASNVCYNSVANAACCCCFVPSSTFRSAQFHRSVLWCFQCSPEKICPLPCFIYAWWRIESSYCQLPSCLPTYLKYVIATCAPLYNTMERPHSVSSKHRCYCTGQHMVAETFLPQSRPLFSNGTANTDGELPLQFFPRLVL